MKTSKDCISHSDWRWLCTLLLTVIIFIAFIFICLPVNFVDVFSTQNRLQSTPKLHSNVSINVETTNIYKTSNTYIVSTHYDNYTLSKPLYIGSYGAPRTGSTLLYNMLRILVRDKIDPNVFNTFWMKEHWQKMLDADFAVIHKAHETCYNMENQVKSKKWWNKRAVSFYTSWRDVRQQICSVIKVLKKAETREVHARKCENYARSYYMCLNNKNIAYDLSYDLLVTNMNKALGEVAKSMYIDDVMDDYDYIRIQNELEHLKCPKSIGNPVTEYHPNHISNSASKTCDYNFIDNVIQSSKVCLRLYSDIRQRRIEMAFVQPDDAPILTLNDVGRKSISFEEFMKSSYK